MNILQCHAGSIPMSFIIVLVVIISLYWPEIRKEEVNKEKVTGGVQGTLILSPLKKAKHCKDRSIKLRALGRSEVGTFSFPHGTRTLSSTT